MPRTVLVTGAQGQLGREIVEAFRPSGRVIALGHRDLDLTDDAAVAGRLRSEQPDLVVNCAADNDVDGAETAPLRALAVNAFAVRALARAVDECGATLVHYSTDFVFDGSASRPYVESDEPNPQGVYAASKLLGEWFALEARRGFVLRVESLFGARGSGAPVRSSLDRIAEGIEAGREVGVFTDRTVSPSYTVDLAAATRALVDVGAAPGLYHCVNGGAATWYAIAEEIARLLGRDARLKPVTLGDVTLRAPRPAYCALDNSRLRAAGVPMPTWQDALARYLRDRRV
jgi:dTDP-4-dehydrorhamnose reductase